MVTLELSTRHTLGDLGNRGWWSRIVEPLATVQQAKAQVAQPPLRVRATPRKAHRARTARP